jgi:transcriptional regulator with XRE-family HTH domain
MATVQRWTGTETKALRQAMRLSIRAFAGYLGVDARTVNKWEARGRTITLLLNTQALLDTALSRAPEDVKTRFSENSNCTTMDEWASWRQVARLPSGGGTICRISTVRNTCDLIRLLTLGSADERNRNCPELGSLAT